MSALARPVQDRALEMPLEVQVGDILHAKRQFQQDGENGGVLHVPRLLERGLHQALVAGEHDGRQIEQQALGAGVGKLIQPRLVLHRHALPSHPCAGRNCLDGGERLGVELEEFGEAQHRIGDGGDDRERLVRVTMCLFVTVGRRP